VAGRDPAIHGSPARRWPPQDMDARIRSGQGVEGRLASVKLPATRSRAPSSRCKTDQIRLCAGITRPCNSLVTALSSARRLCAQDDQGQIACALCALQFRIDFRSIERKVRSKYVPPRLRACFNSQRDRLFLGLPHLRRPVPMAGVGLGLRRERRKGKIGRLSLPRHTFEVGCPQLGRRFPSKANSATFGL
jgi:hypothetical protein